MEILFHCLTWGHSSLGPLQLSHQPRLDWRTPGLSAPQSLHPPGGGRPHLNFASGFNAPAPLHPANMQVDAPLVIWISSYPTGRPQGDRLVSLPVHRLLPPAEGSRRRCHGGCRWSTEAWWTGRVVVPPSAQGHPRHHQAAEVDVVDTSSTWIITWTGPKTLTAVHCFLI